SARAEAAPARARSRRFPSSARVSGSGSSSIQRWARSRRVSAFIGGVLTSGGEGGCGRMLPKRTIGVCGVSSQILERQIIENNARRFVSVFVLVLVLGQVSTITPDDNRRIASGPITIVRLA